MERRNISSGSPYEPVIGFSRAVVVGHHVSVSGTAPIMPEGREPPPDADGQARRVLEIILAALAEAAPRRSTSSAPHPHVPHPVRGLGAGGRVHCEVFGHVRPANTIVVVSWFVDPRWLIEMEADAILPTA